MTTSVKPKERPLLFSGPMVRAILDGRKTQTRRVVKLRPGESIEHGAVFRADDEFAIRPSPYGVVGDRLWVRESFGLTYDFEGNFDISVPHKTYEELGEPKTRSVWDFLIWKATCGNFEWVDENGSMFNDKGNQVSYWKPSIHMPRWASRITLEITGVRVERLNSISVEDAKAEGIEPVRNIWRLYGTTGNETDVTGQPVKSFRSLWRSINGPDSWELNPWVWVVEFKRINN